MMGTAPPHVLAKHVAGRLRKKRRCGVCHFSLGTLVGRALVRGGHMIEFSVNSDAAATRNRRTKREISGVYNQAAMGGRIGRDLYRVATGDNSQPSAAVGNFKITPSSPNTARVTVGPDRRNRRKKYEWEKEGTKSKIRKAVFIGGTTLAIAAGGKLSAKGAAAGAEGTFGTLFKGSKIAAGEAGSEVKRVAKGIAGLIGGKGFHVPSRGGQAVDQDTQKIAEMLRTRHEISGGVHGGHTPTPVADPSRTIPMPPDPNKNTRRVIPFK